MVRYTTKQHTFLVETFILKKFYSGVNARVDEVIQKICNHQKIVLSIYKKLRGTGFVFSFDPYKVQCSKS
jgi:hypothetical protein